MTNVLRRAMGRLGRRSGRFMRAEDGVMAPHILIFFFLMLVTGGIAVDVMRFETKRVAVQNTLDRAALAAASLEQTLDSALVARDYFAKAGLDASLATPTVVKLVNSSTVALKARVVSHNYFMSMLDKPDLRSVVSTSATESVSNIEVALVLDVSGSMFNNYTRITNLKSAAKDFVKTVLEGDKYKKISISLVPYNGQVNLGPQIFGRFNASYKHDYPNSYCLDLPATAYRTTALSLTTAYPQTPMAQSYGYNFGSNMRPIASSTTDGYQTLSQSNDARGPLFGNVWCQPVAANYVSLHQNTIATLQSKIDALVPVGATSIHTGMKWGAYFLDPSARSIVANLAITSGSGVIPEFATRPAAFSDPDTMKIIVLMTDGDNFPVERFNDAYRKGPSNVFLNEVKDSAGRVTSREYALYMPTKTGTSGAYYFWQTDGQWYNYPPGGNSYTEAQETCTTVKGKRTCTTTTVTKYNMGPAKNLDYTELWPRVQTDWVSFYLYARAECGIGTTTADYNCRNAAYAKWENNFATMTGTPASGTIEAYTPEMDNQLKEVCDAAKANGIKVYGIAFETTARGRAAIENCASLPSSTYYFDVSGLEIKTAFKLIATNLRQLRLTK